MFSLVWKRPFAGLTAVLATVSHVTAQQGYYFVLGTGDPLTIERLDPVVNPGLTPSQHVHSVVGGNAFAATMDFAQTQKSTCSTVQPKADKSNYWMPNVYFHDPKNGSYIRVPEQGYHKIYYKYGTGSNTYDTDIQEFPSEFRMIAGSALAREYDSTAMGPYGSGLGWYCHGNGTTEFPDAQGTGFPQNFTGCPSGLAASITMPSCWNGQPFNVSNPSAHMAYPVADYISGCPATHRVARFPQIFVEYWLNVETFNGLYTAEDSPFVLSFGDTTGYGFHVDFLNGWEVGVLNATMPQCIPGNTGNPPLSDPTCFGNRGGIYTDQEIQDCVLKPTVNENVGWGYPIGDNTEGLTYGGVLPSLPGCQTLTYEGQTPNLQVCSN